VAKDATVRRTIEEAGNEVMGSTPEAFKAKFSGDVAMFRKVVKQAKIPPQD
jgi:hypothetical protein